MKLNCNKVLQKLSNYMWLSGALYSDCIISFTNPQIKRILESEMFTDEFKKDVKLVMLLKKIGVKKWNWRLP